METQKNKTKSIRFSIDLSKIPEEKINTRNANGEPYKNGNRYINCVAFINEEPDQYDNIINVALQGKEGEKLIYIGSQKVKKEKKDNDNN